MIALKEQEKVAASHACQPMVRADLMHVGRREHGVVGALQPAQPLGMITAAVIIDKDLDARQSMQALGKLACIGSGVAKGLDERTNTRSVHKARAVTWTCPMRLPRGPSAAEQGMHRLGVR